MTTDVHQHFWPPAFVEALSRRSDPPRLAGSVLELAGERATQVDLAAHDVDARLALLDRCEIDVAVVCLQPTLGADEELAAVYEEGILEAVEASSGRLVALAAGRPADGFAGACVAAPALLDLDAISPTLDALERDGRLVLVHPGPARAPLGAPGWWPAIVEYTAQMQAAYTAWIASGADRWPSLRVVFAILAGGGPFQLERLRSRGVGGRELLHENVYFETASYGPRALDLCLKTFGVGQLCFGSDAPVIDPQPTLDAVRSFGDAVADALLTVNPSRLLT
jgi:6-methylsalicylate decarboxylase